MQDMVDWAKARGFSRDDVVANGLQVLEENFGDGVSFTLFDAVEQLGLSVQQAYLLLTWAVVGGCGFKRGYRAESKGIWFDLTPEQISSLDEECVFQVGEEFYSPDNLEVYYYRA